MLVDGVLRYYTPILPVESDDNSVRRSTNNYLGKPHSMPTGLKQTSSTVAIGFSLPETGANTFTELTVDLNMSPLDREVFVIQAVNLDPESPDCNETTNSATNCSLTSTSQAATARPATLGDSNCFAVAQQRIQVNATSKSAVGFQQQSLETPPSTMDFIGIIATNDFFVQLIGVGNTNPKGVSGKLYGYRARADADIYASLVQSEVLSSI